MSDKKHVNLTLSEGLYRWARGQAGYSGKSLTAWIRDLIKKARTDAEAS